MKTTVLFKQNCLRFVLLLAVSASGVLAKAQYVPEMNFENPSLYSGTAGEDGAVYKFPLVTSQLDAMVTITGRSSSVVSISQIDIPNQGFAKAFQPQIKYNNGNVNSATTWWVEFQIKFVTKNTTTPVTINNFKVTGLDIDGNNDKLKEWDAFYGVNTYTVENNTQLTVSNMTGTVYQPSFSGKKFLGTITDHSGIDTSATELMATMTYVNTSSIIIKLGATTTGIANNANRNYSVWFKNFTYNAPQTLPVQLTSFTATLGSNHKADLKWTTASEINLSHFVVEKSTDGTNYSDAAMIFAYGNATDLAQYSYSDNIGAVQSGIVYYRLRSVDIDGKIQYSETRIIRIGKITENTVTILTYPNPVSRELHIGIPAAWQNKKVIYEVVTTNGQLTSRKESASASQTENINMSSMAPGCYLVRVSCEGEVAQQKIVKQ